MFRFFIALMVGVAVCFSGESESGAKTACKQNSNNCTELEQYEKILTDDFSGQETNPANAQWSDGFFMYYASNSPVMLLVDDTEEAQRAAKRFMENPRTRSVEFFLMKFNTSGTSPVLTSNRNIGLLRRLLSWDDDVKIQTSFIDFEGKNGSAVFFSILNAARYLAPNCAVLVFTSRNAIDEDLAQLALQEVKRKNIRVYVVSVGGHKNGILKELATYSNGAIFEDGTNSVSHKNLLNYMRSDDARKPKWVVVSRRKIDGKQNIQFPIDSGVSSVHVSLHLAQTALLTTPAGYTIDLMNKTDVESFSSGSFMNANSTNSAIKTNEVHLNVAVVKPTLVVGTWHLFTSGDQSYSVVVSVQTKLSTYAYFQKGDQLVAANKERDGFFKLDVSGGVGEVNQINFVDDRGDVLKKDVRFTSHKIKNEDITDDVEIIETNGDEIEIPKNDIPNGPFYVQINGKDNEGNNFTRLSYVNTNINIDRKLPSLTVEVGLGSQLLVKQNEFTQIYFEVTNNKDYTTSVRFRCKDEKSWLVRMQPLFSWLNPRQMIVVTLIIRPMFTNNAGYRDFVTFTAVGADMVEKSVLVKANNDVVLDLDEPKLYHKYTSDCMNVLLGSCEDGTWSIEASAQDDTGLLQLSSNPSGLYFPNGYTAGTTEQVTGYYTGSCCQPKLQLTAVDIRNNRRTYTANAYISHLSPGSIAAIVLGILLLIIIIIAIILLCRWKCKDRDSIELSTYRGPSGRY